MAVIRPVKNPARNEKNLNVYLAKLQRKLNIFAASKTQAMELEIREIITVSMVLFAVIDIVGTIPIMVDLRQKHGHIESEKASIVAGIIMIVFLFVGEELLNLIGIDVNSFAVAGSFVLFFLALEMILGVRIYKDEDSGSASIVPIAFPLIAGAGTMTTLLSLRAQFQAVNIIIAILLNIILVYIVLKSSSKIEKMLGKNGLGVIRKAFGVVLLAIAVKLFAANVKALFA
jgi:multiple antibiotic resistance protein